VKKLKLDLEKIAVESFKTDAEEGKERGTVRGHASLHCSWNPDDTCDQSTCDYAGTCMASCDGGNSCVSCPPYC